MRSQERSRPSSGGSPDAGGRGERGFLTRAAAYDRYHRSLLPGWLKAVLVMAVVALGLAVVWRAGVPMPTGGVAQALAFLLPLAAVVVLWLVSAEQPSGD